MNQPKKRRQFGAERKAEIVRRHLIGKVPVSDLADELRACEKFPHTTPIDLGVGTWFGKTLS